MAQVVKQLPSKHKALRVQTPNCKKERQKDKIFGIIFCILSDIME
jgi:hypothetical protein